MGGMYVSKRNVAGRPQVAQIQTPAFTGPWVDVRPSAGQEYTGTAGFNSSQETMSYRTRGRSGDIEVTPSTKSEFIQLKQESGEFLKPPGYDIGHEFMSKKITRDGGFQGGGSLDMWNAGIGSPDRITRADQLHADVQYNHDGVWRSVLTDPAPEWFITTDDIASGKALINSAAPNRPSFNLSVSLAELISEGLPTLFHLHRLVDRADLARTAGSAYLSVEFGWVPLIADITELAKTLANASAILSNFAKGSGQFIRRKRALPQLQRTLIFDQSGVNVRNGDATSIHSYDKSGNLLRSRVGGFSASTAGAVVSVSCSQDRWFSGAFTYYVPEAGQGFFQDLSRFETLGQKLLGYRFTPETLWELAPWSWLIDWLLGIQNNISVATRFQNDGLVLHYGYLMVRDRITVSTLCDIVYHEGPSALNRRKPAYMRTTYDRKRRVKSTPFGFGLNPSSFTTRQWAILASLGMTKAPGKLR